jgi:hypothetical protein
MQKGRRREGRKRLERSRRREWKLKVGEDEGK